MYTQGDELPDSKEMQLMSECSHYLDGVLKTALACFHTLVGRLLNDIQHHTHSKRQRYNWGHNVRPRMRKTNYIHHLNVRFQNCPSIYFTWSGRVWVLPGNVYGANECALPNGQQPRDGVNLPRRRAMDPASSYVRTPVHRRPITA
jgi:hypothetical protein